MTHLHHNRTVSPYQARPPTRRTADKTKIFYEVMKMEIRDFKKGDTAYLWDYRHDKLKEVKIDAVGRKYVYVFVNERFKKNELYYECLLHVTSSALLFKSLKHFEDYKEHKQLQKELRDAFDWFSIKKLSLEKLRKIKEILESDEND